MSWDSDSDAWGQDDDFSNDPEGYANYAEDWASDDEGIVPGYLNKVADKWNQPSDELDAERAYEEGFNDAEEEFDRFVDDGLVRAISGLSMSQEEALDLGEPEDITTQDDAFLDDVELAGGDIFDHPEAFENTTDDEDAIAAREIEIEAAQFRAELDEAQLDAFNFSDEQGDPEDEKDQNDEHNGFFGRWLG